MAAVTYEYYTGTYIGDPAVTEADFPRMEARAEDIINQLIRYQTVPDMWQTAYQNAICAQIDYYAIYGIDLAAGGIASAGFTVGKVSVSGPSGNASGMTGAASMVAQAARAYLEQTGLLNPSVSAAGWPRPWLWGGW